MNIEIREFEATRFAAVRHVGPYNKVEVAWKQLCEWAGPAGLLSEGSRFIGVCHDDPETTPEDQIRYDACVSIAEEVNPPEGMETFTVPFGKYAVLVHKGPYDGLTKAWHDIWAVWLPGSGEELREAPCFEEYLNDPSATAPEELLTAIYVPIK